MISGMRESQCWQAARGLIEDGKTAEAIAICQTEPCCNVLECQRFLGWTFYERGNFEDALRWFARAAVEEDGDALFGIGSVHFVRRNYRDALNSFQQAAAAGFTRALHWIAYMHHQGLGVPQDVDRAVEYYKRSVAAGYLIAERALIHLTWQRGGLLRRGALTPRYLWLVLRAGLIGARDANDPRIADVPNPLAKGKR